MKMEIKTTMDYLIPDETDFDELEWEEYDSKRVNFYGGKEDYTMYISNIETYCFILGDKDIYTPYNTEPDFECLTLKEALEWFDDYEGIDEDFEGYDFDLYED